MFELMKLPAELRIKIYEYALVRDVIRIVDTAHPFGAVRPPRSPNNHVVNYYEEPNPKKSVSLRSGDLQRTNIKYVRGEEVADEIRWSYGIEPSNSPPLINIFLTNRQIYSETWPIFYQQNAFSFIIPTSIGEFFDTLRGARNCVRFLYDRPFQALRHIRELHLHLGFGPQHPIRFKMHTRYWHILLDEISRYLSVRVLVLYIRGTIHYPDTYHLLSEMPWKDWLCKVNGLEMLHMDIIGTNSREEQVTFVKEMRSRMMVGGEHTGTENFVFKERKIPGMELNLITPLNSLLTSPDIVDMYNRD